MNPNWHKGCNRTSMSRWFYGALIVFASLIPSGAAPVILDEFPFQSREGLLWIEVSVPQSEKPLNFLVDTGAGCSVINLGTARRLGLKLGSEVVVRGVSTNLIGYRQQRVLAKVGSVQLPKKFLAVDLEKFSNSCERPVDGLLGADFFCEHVVQIDFAAQKIRLLKPDKVQKASETLPLQMRPCGIRVPVSVNGGKPQWVRLDTGCATPLQWVTSQVNPKQCSRKTAIGLAELSIAQASTTVSLGARKFENVPTGLHTTPIFSGEAGLLGNGLISRFSSVTIDTEAGRLILE